MIYRITMSCGAYLFALLMASSVAAAPPSNEVVTKSAPDQTRAMDRNRTRYGVTASAFTLNAGESYISQKEIMLTAFSVGVTDHLTLSVSSIIPAWVERGGSNISPALKYGFKLDHQWRVALGFETIIADFKPNLHPYVVHPYAAVTYEASNYHVTLSGGHPFLVEGLETDSSRYYPMTLSANIRLSDLANSGAQYHLILDNAALFYYSGHLETQLYSIWALRVQWDHLAFDFGAFLGLTADGLNVPLPWLDVTYNF